ncbi:hypothetical protein GCM10023219_15340 [Stakelama sediminis]|uniref:Flavin-dependent dehydrogenase n=1 Tax=Stakelama sediminis TaxID=463200 RepID=A0A840YX82_9SPHN|nr:FAD-dependent monooxygenase [Stakelama sediminis]MBB5718263.1 flavin-dependent dehydrogenase [Stakelama sediminis]
MRPLILGAGPAGAVAAMTLARGGDAPIILERERVTGDALCGGFLSWRTLAALERLGVERSSLGDADVSKVRLFAADVCAEAALPHQAKGVSRHRLDSVLLTHALQAGAAVERGVTIREVSDRRVRLADGAELTSDALFLATGKHDVRGAARPAAAKGADPAIGLRIRIGPSPVLRTLLAGMIELHLFDRGYAGLMLQEDGSTNCCMAVHRSRLQEAGSPRALLDALGNACPRLGERLSCANGGDSIDAVANVPYGWRASTTGAGCFRLGDQAGVIPSLAGEGIAIAVASGIRSARAYSSHGPEAAPEFQREFAQALARPIGMASVLRTMAESSFAPWMVRACAAFPSLAGLGARLTRIGSS